MSERRRRSDGSRPTLRDVAQRAGVSTATVSRTMNAPAAVSGALRDRVRAAAAALAFVPDQAARSLSSRHSRLIGVLAPSLRDPGWATAIAAMEARLANAGYALLLGLTGGGAEREDSVAAAMAGRGVEAVVAIGHAPAAGTRAQLSARGIPLAEVDADDAGAGASGAAARAGCGRAGHALGLYLAGLGHDRCAWVAGGGEAPARARAAAVRAGVAAALAEAGCTPLADLPRDGRDRIRAALAAPEPRPTALICTDDALALAMLCELAAAGVAVPRDVSVTGCGDTAAGRCAVPPLTTLRLPFAAAGAAAADAVLARLRGDPVVAPAFGVKLVIRQSTGPVAA
ncbi:MAG: LacI family DNA-binding transcriptional regulator [Burkholderiales bacterium]